MNSYEIYHHGVKGMKWGVRRTKAQLGNRTSAKKSTMSDISSKIKASRARRQAAKQERAKAKEATKPKPIHEMSDEELKVKTARLQAEKNYRDLYRELNPKQTSIGKKVVDDVLMPAGTDLAKQTAKYFGAKAINKMLGEEAVYANNKKK